LTVTTKLICACPILLLQCQECQIQKNYGKSAVSIRTLSFAPKLRNKGEAEADFKHMKSTMEIIMLIKESGFR
jgi:hypothetical protein